MDFSKIDLVVPYVDSSDPEWQKQFNACNPIPNEEIEGVNARNRFRGQGDFFRYFFRGIDKNMPWVRTVHLLVQSKSQVPSWLNQSKVHIVTHDEFIPKEFLPTFNSCTIEMFLWNIPGLSEHFIYTNDDIYAYSKMLPGQFFTQKGECRNMSRLVRYNPNEPYLCHCRNSFIMAYGRDPGSYLAFHHAMRPYIRSLVERCYREHENGIRKSITMFRDACNINVYLYDHYIIRNHMQAPLEHLRAMHICSTTSQANIKAILRSDASMVCINDTDPLIDIYRNSTIASFFRDRLGAKSRFES